MEVPTLDALVTVGGAGVVVLIITQVFWKLANVAPATKDRIGPAVAIAVGILVTLFGTFALGLAERTDIANAILNGLFAGATGMGLHDTIDSVNENIV